MSDSPNALTAALISFAEGSTALEYTHNVSLKDMERSRDRAKDAYEILDAAVKLRKRNIFAVCDEPLADPPLFNTQGEPAPGAEVKDEAELPAEPVAVIPTIGMNVLRVSFEHRILEAESAWKEQGKKLKAFKSVRKAWEARFEQDPEATAKALQTALETPNHDLLPPQKVETPEETPTFATPDFENTTGVDLDEIFKDGPLKALKEEAERCNDDVEALALDWLASWDIAPKATWFALIAVLSNEEAALAVPDPLPEVAA